jgi:3-oxoacyl-[acyl-carrier-protein] synthase III
MIGITAIASYIPENKISNLDRLEKFETDENFIYNKIGIKEVAIKKEDEETSDLAVKAFLNLEKKYNFNREEIEALIVVTQNPDKNIPHTSAFVHGKLELPESCAAFDISLGCSGFVYGLSVIKSFMKDNDFKNGILITADPYSKILDPDDKNTSLLFGDAATATLLTENPLYNIGKFNFGTIGKDWNNLVCDNNILSMNGRGIFNFAAKYVPVDVKNLLLKNNLELTDIDKFIFHQGSKYIVDTLTRRIGLPEEKVAFDILDYGNTVSSSIPIILEKEMEKDNNKKILICGFGVGLSWSSTILYKQD